MASNPPVKLAKRPWPLLSRLLAPLGNGNEAQLRRAVAGKTILVTGASRGIGAALALRLGRAGAHLVLAARTTADLQSLREAMVAAGGTAQVVALDLCDPAQVAQAAAEILSLCGPVDVVVHNAGKSIRRSLLDSLDRMRDFDRTMAVNYLGPVQLQLALLPGMLSRGGGQIVNVSTLAVRLPPAPRWSAYTASKGAMDLWMAANAPELAVQNISTTSVYFGLVHTQMSAPTEMYRTMPGLTADEAAQVLCRALISQPRRISPWWLPLLRGLSVLVAPLVEPILGAVFRQTEAQRQRKKAGHG